jgi:GH18 family chitinase
MTAYAIEPVMSACRKNKSRNSKSENHNSQNSKNSHTTPPFKNFLYYTEWHHYDAIKNENKLISNI